MDGCGWEAVMLTWFYALLWFMLADAAKALLHWVRTILFCFPCASNACLAAINSRCCKPVMLTIQTRHQDCRIAEGVGRKFCLCNVLHWQAFHVFQVFQKHTRVELAAKEHGHPRPWWAKVINFPSKLGDRTSQRFARQFKVRQLANSCLPVEACLLQCVTGTWLLGCVSYAS